jgi:hypothetical protein
METAALIAIIRLIAAYGVPGMLKIIREWQKDEPTDQDWDELLKLPAPEEFLGR